MERFLALVVSLLLAGGLMAAVVKLQDDPAVDSIGTTDTTVPFALEPDQVHVTGIAAVIRLDDASASTPIATPFTIVSPQPGQARLKLENAIVGRARSAVVWQGGRPLPVTGQGSISGVGSVVADQQGLHWELEGTTLQLDPGTYRLGSTVAVGSGGLGTPRDAVEFRTDEQTVLFGSGGARVDATIQPVTINGTGRSRARLEGTDLQVRTPDGTRTAKVVEFGLGSMKVTLTPAPGGWQVDAVLQGPVRTT